MIYPRCIKPGASNLLALKSRQFTGEREAVYCTAVVSSSGGHRSE